MLSRELSSLWQITCSQYNWHTKRNVFRKKKFRCQLILFFALCANIYIYIHIYLFILTAVELTPGDSSTVHNGFDTRWQQYSTHLHTNSTQNAEKGIYITMNRKYWEVRAVPRCELYTGICLTTEVKAQKNLS
jgi:hypothetical protein